MLKLTKPFVAGAAMLACGALPAAGADIVYEPPVIDYEPPQVVYHDKGGDAFGGWYIRGDVGYRWNRFRGAEYYTYPGGVPVLDGSFDTGKLKGSFSVGGGIGYQFSSYLRADLTADYWGKANFRGSTSGFCAGGVPCTSVDTTKFSALLLLANAYVELGTYKRFTPYVGAGMGGAWVKWDDLNNRTSEGDNDWHRGAKGWRFAWALMAGTSYCINKNWKADVGYRFSRIEGGRMFQHLAGANVGPGNHKALHAHEVRGGLRYQFGGDDRCGGKEYVYKDPEPVFPPIVYK